MRKTSILKRPLAALLTLVMILGMIPVFGGGKIALDAEAVPVDSNGVAQDYITLPITIRDFAADGMLFEYNEVDSSDTITTGGATATGFTVYLNPSSWDVNNYYGIRVYDYGEITFDTTNTGASWYCIICDASGNVLDVMAAGEEKETTYNSTMVDGGFSVWAWQGDHDNYALLSTVTDTNKGAYVIDFNEDASKWYIGYRYYENAWHSNYEGISYFAAGQNPFDGYGGDWAECLICDASGNVIQYIPGGDGQGQVKQAAFNALTSGFALFATPNDTAARGIIMDIGKNNPTSYQASFVNDNYYGNDLLFLSNSGEETKTIHQNNTKGFGLMLTNDKDRIHNLTDTSGPGTYVSNGTYGSSTVPDPIDIVLNSGATQKGYGITIRKDLVGPTLVNGKPAYTEDTITYLAAYMNQIMAEPWQNADGSYNSFFVMGTKLFDASGVYVGPDDPTAVYDLAAMLRQFVGDGGLGDYATTMAKAATLTDVSKCKTWFDAAYYLLHYTWQDSLAESNNGSGSDGYGKYVPQYDSLQLVAKTQDDGSVYYVFNSAYDGTVYDPNNKEIYNTQTSTITAAKLGGSDFYTRGIILPAARFDPLGFSGTASVGTPQWLGYGENAGGNTYGDLTGASATQSWADYYDTTNYHLSLEGHAEFIFHYSSNLYFTFTGDDDVYLYINGYRVLDLGAAHSIVKATINLNDVAELCGLKEGEPARFDFFYLERHGTAANFGIETNIQLAESGMITSKEGYQNGTTTGYDGPVDPSKPVAYSFTLKNSGEAKLEHLTFKDEKLGVSLSEYAIDLGNKLEKGPNGTALENLYLYIRDENDAIVRFYSATTETPLSEAVLMEELKTGLPAGYSMTIYNFRYKITDKDWEEGSGSFTNIVNTTAISNGKQVAGTADWKVRKAALVTDPFHIYNWVNKDLDDTEWQSREVSLTKAELVQPVLDAAEKNEDTDLINKTNSSADIVLCDSAGLVTTALWSEEYTNIIANVTLGEDDSLVYNSKTPGMVTIYYKIENIGYPSRVYHFDVITYGVADNVYVLDYGLNVELNKEYGFRENDHLTVPQNIHPTTMTMDVRQTEHTWGEFVNNGEDLDIDTSVEYQPKDIINGCDSMKVTIKLRETGADTSKALKYYGVDMLQTVSTAPANVVYYEENHPGITYVSEGENQWIHYETMDGDQSTAGTNQSPDQDLNYGYDDNYEEDKVGTLEPVEEEENVLELNLDTSDLDAVQKLGIAALNTHFGLAGGDSNGTVNKLEVKQTADVMYFDFIGTGFEIISRTTAGDFAIINVQVMQDTDGNGTYETLVGYKPVITESKGGNLYQIPVISVTGLERGNYKVTVKAAGSTSTVNRVLYIDGIRIYGTLSTEKALEYYNPAEYQAEFHEVKQLIADGKLIYADLGEIEGVLQFVTGYSMVENTFNPGEGAVLMQIDSQVDPVKEYMSVGPNNELYLEGNSAVSLIAFMLKPKENWPEAEKTLQIGAHRKANSGSEDMGSTAMTYSDNFQDLLDRADRYFEDMTVDGTNSYIVASGTEMYYTIDLSKLTPDENGNYLVMVAAIGSEWYGTNLALTNIKVSGYEIYYAEAALQTADEEGTLEDEPLVQQTFGLLRGIRELLAEEPETEQVPVNENLQINSAVLGTSKVISGRTVSLTVKAGTDAQVLVVTDSQGNQITPTRSVRKVSGDVAIFTYVWKVTGSSGQVLNYNVRVYDESDLASVNVETVTVTIR